MSLHDKKKSKVIMTQKHFLEKKFLHGPHKEPVWVYLEKEMREKAAQNIKPYNKKVGEWLRFLEELKWFFFVESKKRQAQLKKGAGPIWFYQLSTYQATLLQGLKDDMHQDIILGLPEKTEKALQNLGLFPKPPAKVVMRAMMASEEDPGLFIWHLYTLLFGHEPTTVRKSYNMNAMILMSALVAIDLEKCIDGLGNLTHGVTPELTQPFPKKKPNKIPKVKYGVYLQIPDEIPCYECKNMFAQRPRKQPVPIDYKFKVRNKSQLEKARLDMTFLKKRAESCQPKKEDRQVTNYKFWEPPPRIKSKGDAMKVALQMMFKKKPKMATLPACSNLQFNNGGVAYCGGRAYYVINGAVTTPTPYIPVHGGMTMTEEGYAIPYIQGMFQIPIKEYTCDDDCNCMKWLDEIIAYLKDSKCTCGHLYDFKHEGKCKEKFFMPATRHGPFSFDLAKIFQFDETTDLIKHTMELMARSESRISVSTAPSVPSSGMNDKEVLSTLLADLSTTPLILPHLPDATSLPVLLEWCRHRRHGDPSLEEIKRDFIFCAKKWMDLQRTRFREPAYTIPFTEQELHTMNWSHRKLVGNLFTILLNDFTLRNRIKQVEQTRLFWSSLKADKYPSKSFLDAYFTYMPGRLQDIYFFNPYSSALIKKDASKTCPLDD